MGNSVFNINLIRKLSRIFESSLILRIYKDLIKTSSKTTSKQFIYLLGYKKYILFFEIQTRKKKIRSEKHQKSAD